jgi:hypothetical protein
MRLDLERVRQNVRAATTEDLLDRITVYRAGMEPAAIEIIETELDRRGVGEAEIAGHAQRRAGALTRGGIARRCSRCPRPAVQRCWGWHRLWGKVPLFPELKYYCEEHRRA